MYVLGNRNQRCPFQISFCENIRTTAAWLSGRWALERDSRKFVNIQKLGVMLAWKGEEGNGPNDLFISYKEAVA